MSARTAPGRIAPDSPAVDDPPVASRSDRPRRRFTALQGLASVLIGLAIWQLVVVIFQPSDLVIVAPTEVVGRLAGSLADGSLWPDLAISLQAFLVGYAIAFIVAIPLGLAIGSSRWAHEWSRLWISGLYATPIIGLAPLFVILFGYGLQAKAAVVFTLAVFPMLINTIAGARAVGQDFKELAVVFGASRFETFRTVLVPGSTPFIATGLRLAVGRGLIGVVVADLFGASAGLGLNLQRSAGAFDTANIFAVTLLLAVLGVALTALVEVVERRAYARSGMST
jgi:ABC-type nitrate/sulfonate/bicarbonate transport system permease component